jgi:hypothetical protein
MFTPKIKQEKERRGEARREQVAPDENSPNAGLRPASRTNDEIENTSARRFDEAFVFSISPFVLPRAARLASSRRVRFSPFSFLLFDLDSESY